MLKAFVGLCAALAAVGLIATAGCGGGTGASGSGTLNLYAMDGFDDEYSQVWATLQRIEVGSDGGSFTTVYEAAEGAELNLPELATTAEFLGAATLPARNYTRARLTLRNTVRLVRRDGSESEPPLRLETSLGFRAGTGDSCTVEFPVNCTVRDGGQTDLPIDFDLPNFQMMGNALQARVQQGDANRFRAMNKHGRLLGTVTNLDTASFDLALRNGRIVPVELTAATTIVSAGSGADAALANGQTVFVFGVWDAVAQKLSATVVIIMDIPTTAPAAAHARGTVLSIDDAEKSFVMEYFSASMGLRPTSAQIKVKTGDSTVFGFVPRGPASFADVAVGSRVDVVGVYDAAEPSISARRVLIVR